MQAVPVNATVLPQAPVDTSARPSGSDGSKTRFTEYLQRKLEQPSKDSAPAQNVKQEDVELLDKDESPDEEAAVEMMSGLIQSQYAQWGGEAASESAAGEEPIAVEGLDGNAWTAPAEAPVSGAAAHVHVKMVQEKIAEILEADLASLAEPEVTDEIPGAPVDGIKTEETDDAPSLEGEPSVEPVAAAPLEAEHKADGAKSALTGGSEQSFDESKRTDEAQSARVVAGAAAPQTVSGAFSELRAEIQIRTEAAERALMRFSQDLHTLRTGVSEIHITLEPESLGELTITVMKTGTGVSARITSPDRDVCSAVADKLPILLQSIEKNGLTMQDLEVIHSPMNFNNNAQEPGHSGRQGGRRGQSFRAVAAASGDDDTAFWSDFHQSGQADDATVVYRI